MKTFNLSRSSLMTIGLVLAVLLWMLTGLVGNGSTPSPVARSEPSARELMAVSVRNSAAGTVTREIVISGRTAPNRSVEIAAEAEGRVVAVEAERGARLEEGQAIVRLDLRDRQARAREAEALLALREQQFEAAEQLRGRDFLSEAQIAEAAAQLESARAELERARLELERTTVVAPFTAVLDERAVELGDYLGVGDPVGTVVDIDPLVVWGDVSERDITALHPGDPGQARLLDGSLAEGHIRYIAPVANEATRTFRVELAIPNPDLALRAGTSAELILPAGEITAHPMSPALLTLNDAGEIGVKAVDERDKVVFHPVEIALSDANGVWVTGLPPRLRVITVGQGFVAAGETVRPVEQAPLDAAAAESGATGRNLP